MNVPGRTGNGKSLPPIHDDRTDPDEFDTEAMTTITLTREQDWYVITDEETGVSTQGQSKLEALVMLTDALAAYEESDVDLLGLAIDVFVPDPSDALPDQVRDDERARTGYDVVVEAAIEDRFREVATEVTDGDDPEAAVEELRNRIVTHTDAGEPWLPPPLSPDEIDAIEDDRLRALAWDLDAISRAYNYASDPTLPDLARKDPSPWLSADEQRRLERAAKLLFDAYERLDERVGEDLQRHRRGSEER